MPNESPFTRESASRTDPVVGTASTLLCGAAIDASTAGAFAIGGTNATTITIGRTGQTVTLPGNLSITGTTTSSTVVDMADRVIRLGVTGASSAPTVPVGIAADRGSIASTDSALVWDETASRWKFAAIDTLDDTSLGAYQTVQALRFDAPTFGRADAGVLSLGGSATSIVSGTSIAGSAIYGPTIGRVDAGALAFGGSATSIVAGAPITFAATQLGTIQTRSVTIGHADLTDADGEQSINIGATLPENAMIIGVNVALATPFTGGGAGSVLLDVGTSTDADAIVANCDLFAAAVDGVASTMPAGIAPFKVYTSAGAQLLATVAADVNVVLLAAGAATITVSFVVIS